MKFLSTPSARRATHSFSLYAHPQQFLSTPSARRATSNVYKRWMKTFISIHALREEGDLSTTERASESTNFYPRPPRGGRRFKSILGWIDNIFLSTPSARRATGSCPALRTIAVFLSTPSARRATSHVRSLLSRLKISIHALREEGD